jgi:hypothetical protein
MRCAMIDIKTNVVVNVIDVEAGDGTQAPSGMKLVEDISADIGDAWDGQKIVRKPQPAFVPRGA